MPEDLLLRPAVSPEELEQFRTALQRAIERSGLRAVAREVSMSPTGLANFLGGTSPYSQTIARVRDWYYGRAAGSRYSSRELAHMLRSLVSTLPQVDRGVANLLDAVERSYAEQEMFSPEWVRSVRAEVGGADPI